MRKSKKYVKNRSFTGKSYPATMTRPLVAKKLSYYFRVKRKRTGKRGDQVNWLLYLYQRRSTKHFLVRKYFAEGSCRFCFRECPYNKLFKKDDTTLIRYRVFVFFTQVFTNTGKQPCKK